MSCATTIEKQFDIIGKTKKSFDISMSIYTLKNRIQQNLCSKLFPNSLFDQCLFTYPSVLQ